MKELSIEQKAKRYDEALAWMRDLYPSMRGAMKEDAEHYFPELKESEDEKMKRIISDILLIDSDDIREILDSNGVLMQDIDAWLEKQGS